MSRLNLTDSTLGIATKMSEGNPGALTVLIQLMRLPINWDSAFYILWLDENEIYSSRIWLLYKDVCKENIEDMCSLITGCQMGLCTIQDISCAMDNYGRGIDVKGIVELVNES